MLSKLPITDFYSEEDITNQFQRFIENINKFRDGDCDPTVDEFVEIKDVILTIEKAFDNMKDILTNHK